MALLWLVPAAWSSNYLIARAAAEVLPPHLLAFGRWGLVFLVLFAWHARTLLATPERLRAEARQLLVLGALGMWICGAWVYLGGRTTTATNIGILYAAAPVGIAVGSARLLGERIGPAQRVAMGLALAGVLVVVSKGDPAVLLGVRFTPGDGWILAAVLAWIAYSLLLRAWPTRLSTGERLCATAAGGLLVLLPFSVAELVLVPWTPTPRALGLIVLAGLLPGLLSYAAYAFMQRELGAARTAMVMYLAPVYAAALAWLLLGERPQPYHLVGALLILPGIHFATRSPPAHHGGSTRAPE